MTDLMTRRDRATSTTHTTGTVAATVEAPEQITEVQRRRERAGLHKNELAELAGVNRDTLGAIEAGGKFRRASMLKIEAALTAFEHEHGITAPPPSGRTIVIVRLRNSAGDEVAVEGPIDDIEALEASADRLLARRRPPAG